MQHNQTPPWLLINRRYIIIAQLQSPGENVRQQHHLEHTLPQLSLDATRFSYIDLCSRKQSVLPLAQILHSNENNHTPLLLLSIFLDRLSPYEWDFSEPWKESDEKEFDMNLHNCFWHNWGSLMQQGSDLAPRYRVLHHHPWESISTMGLP